MHSSFLSLLQLCDPMLPIGGFAHSAGLETYVQHKIVYDKATACQFITGMLQRNIRYTDAAFASLAFDAAVNKNAEAILLLDTECNALKLPRELRQASQKTGMRLIKIFQPLYNCENGAAYRLAIEQKNAAGHYCIAFGLYAAALGIAKVEALYGFYYNAAAGFVTNCVKLIPIGQQQGQEILFSLHDIIDSLVQQTMQPNKTMLGLCCPGFDIRSMQHERLYSRLYMS